MAFYIGVDGGGTKTAYALFDENKNIVDTVQTKGSNHENYEGSFDEAVEIIWGGIWDLLAKTGKTLEDIDFTLMGLAGVDHPFQHDALYERLAAKGLKNFELYNDGFIVVKAGSISGAAIGYNCGTGTCCNAIDSDGKMLQLAGFGEFSGDIANGHWIASTAYSLIYNDVVLGVEKTALTDIIFKKHNLKSREDFLAMVSEFDGDDAETYIRSMIVAFFDAANAGDAVVMRVIEQMATRGAQLICAHINQLNFAGEKVEIVLSGSIHTKLPSKVYKDLLEKKVREQSGRDVMFICLESAPLEGCINWIFQEYIK